MADTFSCRDCARRYCDEARNVYAAGPHGKPVRSKGRAPGPRAGWEWIDERGEPGYLEVCPLPTLPDGWRTLAHLHRLHDLGNLPWAGGLLDQPAWYPEAMETIGTAYARAADLRQRRREEAMKRGR